MINNIIFENPEYVKLHIDYDTPDKVTNSNKPLIQGLGKESTLVLPKLDRDIIFQAIDYQLQTTNKLKKYNETIGINEVWVDNLHKVNSTFTANEELMENLRKVMFAGLVFVKEWMSILENRYKGEVMQKFTVSTDITINNTNSFDYENYINLYIGYGSYPKATSAYIAATYENGKLPIRKYVQRTVHYYERGEQPNRKSVLDIRLSGFEPEIAANFFQDKLMSEYIRIYYNPVRVRSFSLTKISKVKKAKRLPMSISEWLDYNRTIEELKTDKVVGALNIHHYMRGSLPKEYVKLKSRLSTIRSYTKHDINAPVRVRRLSISEDLRPGGSSIFEAIVDYENEENMLHLINPKTSRSVMQKINDEVRVYCGLAKI